MICRVCGAHLSGETAHIGQPMCAASGYEDDYILIVSCPCGATHGVRLWQSEESAVEDWLEDEREADGVTSLLGDTAAQHNHDRDYRESA
jgi:hypothetical protein